MALMQRVVAIVPAWNEEELIGETLEALQKQELETGYVLEEIVVVANNCTDRTADVARTFGVTVLEVPDCPGKKAGAMNIGWRHLVDEGRDIDFVFTMDADTVLLDGALQGLIDSLEESDQMGGACSRYHAKDRNGLVRRLQSLEYARNDDARELRNWRVQVASGAAVMYKQSVLKEVIAKFGRESPWDVDSLIEDYGLTLDIKTLGYQVKASEGSVVLTDTPATVKELWKQRLRWGRGGIDECRKRGWTKATRRDICSYGLFGFSLFLRIAFIVFIAVLVLYQIPFRWSAVGMVPLAVMWFDRVTSVARLKDKTWKDRMLVWTILFEDFYGFFMEFVTVRSLVLSIGSKDQGWR